MTLLNFNNGEFNQCKVHVSNQKLRLKDLTLLGLIHSFGLLKIVANILAKLNLLYVNKIAQTNYLIINLVKKIFQFDYLRINL